jgi:hypothetical protein
MLIATAAATCTEVLPLPPDLSPGPRPSASTSCFDLVVSPLDVVVPLLVRRLQLVVGLAVDVLAGGVVGLALGALRARGGDAAVVGRRRSRSR